METISKNNTKGVEQSYEQKINTILVSMAGSLSVRNVLNNNVKKISKQCLKWSYYR